jgi:hypothetical protein
MRLAVLRCYACAAEPLIRLALFMLAEALPGASHFH